MQSITGFLSKPMTFNSTLEELKYVRYSSLYNAGLPFNSTLEELKYYIENNKGKQIPTFNSTLEELKFAYLCIDLQIGTGNF